MLIVSFFTILLISYLMGSISSAILICKAFGLPDPRTIGSGNPGATNVMRSAGKKVALFVFLGDSLKGLIPILVVRLFFNHDAFILAAALGAFLGHLYPIYFSFQGGKGVATLAGILLAINPWLFLSFGIVWFVTFKVTKLVAIASIAGCVATIPVAFLLKESYLIILLLVILNILVIYRHRTNISRILKGEELTFKKDKKA